LLRKRRMVPAVRAQHPYDMHMSPHSAWRAVCARDASADGHFVFAVATTGVYCRPSCSARRPRRENVRFFTAPAEAERAGFRACKRCHPADAAFVRGAEVVARACRLLSEDVDGSPTLTELGRRLGVSPFHLQRTFKRITGVSPRAWVAARRLQAARAQLGAGASVTEAVYQAGFGSASRLYERSDAHLGMTPATYRKGGAGVQVRYATRATQLGIVLLARSARGVCAVSLGDDATTLVRELRARLHAAELIEDASGLADELRLVCAQAEGRAPAAALPLDVHATAFEGRVWAALAEIPRGETRTYEQVAQAIGAPRATRAVAQACARNPVALLVPCHRVVRKGGAMGGYRWGAERKARLLEAEATAGPRAASRR
jgi:AraC family transcriptional regulator, regulatory protein of adaptative response / methylated-DNA-[protein]-cysteine methyltransferase